MSCPAPATSAWLTHSCHMFVLCLSQGFKKEAHWQPLVEDKAINALTDEESPGSLLLRLGLGSREEAEADTWEDDLTAMHVCEVLLGTLISLASLC